MNAVSRPRNLRIAIVGSANHVDALCQWLERCRGEIEGKEDHLKALFADFPGFNEQRAFRSTLELDERLQRPINERELRGLKDPTGMRTIYDDRERRQSYARYVTQMIKPRSSRTGV